jgi:metallo-beta-lactamase family protein
LRPPDAFPQCDYLITESTYGDRLHQDKKGAEDELLRIVKYTCVEKKGKLIIPSFAIGRTQEVVYMLNNFYNEGKLPRIPIYVDSPLAVNATDIFRMHYDQFNIEVQQVMQNDDDPFGFGTLHYIKNVNDSKKLNQSKDPCVIISASGMMEAGRVKHHLANNVDNPANSVLAVGYCAPRTLGARILSGEKDISIFGNPHHIKADIFKIDAFSGHGDYKEMSDYMECQQTDKIKKLFLVHGDDEAREHYTKILKKKGFKNIVLPAHQEEFELKPV